jgi:heme/copper-type cytochrome/quinol oxidase subunit 2
MRPHRLVLPAFVLTVFALVAFVYTSHATTVGAASAMQNAPAVKEIAIKAKKYDFTPNKIDIPVNTSVRFAITAEDHDHGFEIEGVKDSCVKIPKGETKTVDYRADKTGTFKFKCCDLCGIGHGGMKGQFTVK